MSDEIKKFRRGGHIVLGVECRRSDTNDLETPSTSYTVDLWDCEGTQVLTGQALTEDSTGKLSYNYAVSDNAPVGIWEGTFWMNSGGVKTPLDFKLEIVAKVF